VETLWQTSAHDLRQLWRSVLGERWYWMLRGHPECDYQPMQRAEAVKKSVGHSNVLAPEHQTLAGAKRILLELIGKALKRLRDYGQMASAVQVTVRYRRCAGAKGPLRFTSPEGVWVRRSRKHRHTNADLTWLYILRPLLEALPDLHPSAQPCYVGVVFSALLKEEDTNLSLFEEENDRARRLALTIDALNSKKPGAVRLAAYGREDAVPQRIPFGAPEKGRSDG
jgi:DNA polymerase-4